MSAERLAVGDLIRCPGCRQWHAAEVRTGGSATNYAERMLYVRCGGSWRYIGQAGLPCHHEVQSVAGSCARCGDVR